MPRQRKRASATVRNREWRMARPVFLFVYLTLLVCSTATTARAQTTSATLSGTIMDAAGRVVPDVDVSATNVDTGITTDTKTNGDGIYVLTTLQPGHYRVIVTKPGFKQIALTDVILHVQDTVSRNFNLDIGAVSETITVEGGAPMIDTTDASVSTIVDRQFAENLPLNGRSFQSLIYLAPGVVVVPTNTFDNGQFSVNGQRAASNYWMVDGVSANIGVGSAQLGGGNGLGGSLGSFSALGGTNSLVSVDALQEFRIQTSSYAPEFGRTPGGQISIVTRSGTNQFHGTAFDYLRNSAFDASNWFNGYINNPPLPKAEERQNDFGGTLGGPIRKDRSFFFFSYEGLRLRLPETTLTTVPDLSARQSAVAPMQPYLNAFPLPNGPETSVAGTADFNASYSNPATLDAVSLRVDQRLGNSWNIFGRYNYSPSEFEERGAGANGALSVLGVSKITTQTGTVGASWTISTTSTNDLRFNYSRTNARSSNRLDDFGGAVVPTSLPLPSGFGQDNSLFSLSIFSLTGFNLSAGVESQVIQRQINIVDNLSLQRGAHSVKLGIDYRRLNPELVPREYQQVASFFSIPQAVAGRSSGNVSSFALSTIVFHNAGFFAQDTWRLSPKLTFTYGLRWDIDFAPSSSSGPQIPAVTGYSLTDLSHLAIAPVGTPPFHTSFGGVAPRLGVAYQLFTGNRWQTVLRGSFGIFYDLVSSEAGNSLANGFPPFGTIVGVPSSPFPFSPAQTVPPVIPPTGTLARINAFNPNLELPYTLQWNGSVEQALGKDQALSVSYVGAAGRRLLQTTEFSEPPTNPAILVGTFIDNTATSDYDALQVQFRRRLSAGLQGVASYTWSHSIDDASAGSALLATNISLPGSRDQNRGNSDFDIRNAFSAGLTYDVPCSVRNRIGKSLLQGWSTENFILARSAPPLTVTDINFFLFSSGVTANIQPDVVPGQPLYLYGPQFPGGKALNPAAFTDPPSDPITGDPLRQGDLPRNKLRGFGATEWDMAIHRDFAIRESWKLQFRAELFNVLNHPNFGPPNPNFGAGGFGISTQTLNESLSNGSVGAGGFDPLYQIGGPRSIQLALKLSF